MNLRTLAAVAFLPVLFACPPKDDGKAQDANVDAPTVVVPPPAAPPANANVANPNAAPAANPNLAAPAPAPKK